MSKEFHKLALDYHKGERPGKIQLSSHKALDTHHDLSLAYTPGVAAPVREIAKNPELVYDYTIKGNLVAVISDGSAVLGLGNIFNRLHKFIDILGINFNIKNINISKLLKQHALTFHYWFCCQRPNIAQA